MSRFSSLSLVKLFMNVEFCPVYPLAQYNMLTVILILFSVLVGFDGYQVRTSSGTVRGKTIEVLNSSVTQFLNIPYAEPPVGRLRFSKPLPLKEPIEV